MNQAAAVLKKGEGRLLKSGGMWVFDNEIESVMGSFVNGDIIYIRDFDGYPLGQGFINTASRITIRLLTRDEHRRIDEAFFKDRVQEYFFGYLIYLLVNKYPLMPTFFV